MSEKSFENHIVYEKEARQWVLDWLAGNPIDQLRQILGTPDALGNWRHPVEEQDQVKPPK